MANITKTNVLGRIEASPKKVAVAVLMGRQKNLTTSSPCTDQREGVVKGCQKAVIRTRTVSRLLVNLEKHRHNHVQE